MEVRFITPILNVSDIDASFAWFEKLGWRRLWRYDGFAAVGSGLPAGRNGAAGT